ncbi:hypothetical protein C7B76_28855, partial [filamentous cyanobacterium CCP2]
MCIRDRVDPARANHRLWGGKAETAAGSGLGLAITSVIVENHQGQIHVESTLNQGTVFTVWLPCQFGE